MTDVQTAVTSVTPAGAPAPAPAKTTRKGRPPLLLKNGKPYAEAKAEAKQGVLAAKRAKADLKAAHRDLEKAVSASKREGEELAKSLGKAEAVLAKAPKDADAKFAVKQLKDGIKENARRVKDAEKQVAASLKGIDKADQAYNKAHAAALKVEEQKQR